MSKVILHISDLHVTTYKGNDGSINDKIESYLTTNDNEEKSIHFLDTFISIIKKDYALASFILLITGDITDRGEIKEFTFAYKFIKKLMDELNIKPDDCLIVPGDHDVHRRSLDNALEETPSDTPYLMNNVKLKYFAEFFFNIKNQQFPFDQIIINHIVIDQKVVLLGINSNYKIGNKGGEGFIPVEKFTAEIETLKRELNDPDFQYIACWHHNFTASFDDTNSGQWEPENRRYLLAQLERQNIKLVFTGNEHTSSSKSILNESIKTSDCGAFSSVKNDSAFKAYPVLLDGNIILENKIYGLQKPNVNDSPFFWNIRNNVSAKQPESFVLFKKNEQEINEVQDLPYHEPELAETSEQTIIVSEKAAVFYNNSSIADKLYNIIREKKLFHSGHFHWSESSRAHNWIDVAKLLENNENFYFVQNAIIDIIETFNLAADSNLIIGLGYEGNILSSKASIKYNIPYTSLPYSYRYDDHHDYERKLNYENQDGRFKTVIIITDVVNDGRTIRKLIDKREKLFFEKVEKIIVLSLFYTGHQSINTDILNFNRLPANYDSESDYEVNNIEFYTVKSLRVEKCPYGKNYREECFIFKDELSCVHLFYDDVNG